MKVDPVIAVGFLKHLESERLHDENRDVGTSRSSDIENGDDSSDSDGDMVLDDLNFCHVISDKGKEHLDDDRSPFDWDFKPIHKVKSSSTRNFRKKGNSGNKKKSKYRSR
jgi:hypothetical protein